MEITGANLDVSAGRTKTEITFIRAHLQKLNNNVICSVHPNFANGIANGFTTFSDEANARFYT